MLAELFIFLVQKGVERRQAARARAVNASAGGPSSVSSALHRLENNAMLSSSYDSDYYEQDEEEEGEEEEEIIDLSQTPMNTIPSRRSSSRQFNNLSAGSRTRTQTIPSDAVIALDSDDDAAFPVDLVNMDISISSDGTDTEIRDGGRDAASAAVAARHGGGRVRARGVVAGGGGGRRRGGPSVATQERLTRALSNRMVIMEANGCAEESFVESERDACAGRFVIMGVNGNVYHLEIGVQPRCDCDDFLQRSENFSRPATPCKHLLFVYMRVYKLDREDRRWWQEKLTVGEIHGLRDRYRENGGVAEELMAENGPRRGGDATNVSRMEVVNADEEEDDVVEIVCVEKRRKVEGDCPICFDALDGDEECSEIVKQCRHCKNYFHANCLAKWTLAGGKKTCPLCRGNVQTGADKSRGRKKRREEGSASASTSIHARRAGAASTSRRAASSRRRVNQQHYVTLSELFP